MRKCLTLVAGLAAISLFTGISRAELLSGCGTCQGSTYLLQYNPTNTTTSGADNVYDVFLTINTAGYNVAGGAFLDTVLVKIASSVDLPPSTLVAAPGGAGAWSLQQSGLNAGGCGSIGSQWSIVRA